MKKRSFSATGYASRSKSQTLSRNVLKDCLEQAKKELKDRRRRILVGRKDERKDGPFAYLSFESDGSPVRIGDAFHNREAKAGAAAISCSGEIGPIKPLKKVGHMLRLNPGAGILDADSHPFVHLAKAYGHFSARRGIPNGIVEQINYRLLEPLGIAEHKRRRLGLQGERNLMVFGEHAQFIDEFSEQELEIEGHPADWRAVTGQPGEGEEFASQRHQALHLFQIINQGVALFLIG